MFLLKFFAYSYIMMCIERLSYIFLWERNPSAMSLKMSSASVVWDHVLVKIDVHSLSMQFVSAMGL